MMDSIVNQTLVEPLLTVDELTNATLHFANNGTFAKWIINRLRIFLYLSDPYEEMFETEDLVPDYHAESFPFYFFFIMFEWFVLWCQGKPLPLLGDSAASVGMILNFQCVRLICRGLEHSLYFHLYYNYRIIDLPWDSPYSWYLAALCVDFCYYWGHRASHVINALWSHHQAHHSAEFYSLVNVFRLPLTQEWLYAFSYIPISLVVPPSLYLVHHQMNLLYQFWLHTEVIDKVGPLEWVLNTPSHHRVHHGSNKYCLDKNFGGWLIIWDRMFGTFQEELPDVPIVYGLVDQVKSYNPLYVQVHYYQKMHQKWQSMDGWKNKFYSVIKGPGWRPGSPWTGFMEEVPDVTGREKHIYKTPPLIVYLYFAPHTIITVLGYEAINISKDFLSPVSLLFHLVYVVFTSTLVGMFVNGHPLAPVLEFFRCTVFFLYSRVKLVVVANVVAWFGLTEIWAGYLQAALRTYFFLGMVGWGLVCSRKLWERALRVKMKQT